MKKLMSVLVLGAFVAGTPVFATTASDVLFVIMGGRTSCGSSDPAPTGIGMYKPFSQMLSGLETTFAQTKFHYIVTCFNSDPPPDAEMPYITSEDPTGTRTGNADDIQKLITDFKTKYAHSALIFVGHSYGGFLSMYLAQNFNLTQPIDGLFSVDPIGPLCGPSAVVFGSQDCFEAPTNVDDTTIKQHVGMWKNIYETDDEWLHSSEIAEAQNTQLDFHGPHTEIDRDPRTWVVISDGVNAILRPAH